MREVMEGNGRDGRNLDREGKSRREGKGKGREGKDRYGYGYD
jgi:hypothetical protein